MTTIATLNIKAGLAASRAAADVERLLSKNPDIIGFNEVPRGLRTRRIRRALAEQGYGFFQGRGANPIAWDLSRYKVMERGNHFLTPRTFVGKAGAGPSTLRRKDAAYVVLKDRKTGRVVTFTAAHLAPSRHLGGKRAELHRKQIEGLAELQRVLGRKHPKAQRFLAGDLNTSNPALLRKIRQAGLKTYKAPRKTHKVGAIDWIAGDAKLVNRYVLGGMASDHDAYVGKFGGGRGKASPAPGAGRNSGSGRGKKNEATVAKNYSAYELFRDLLESWDLPIGNDIEKIIRQAVTEGITPDQISLIIPDIQETKSWRDRFPGWHRRVDNGYNQLTVGEYLALEDEYHRIMQENGLPKGFYDDPSDFGSWIANNISPDEISDRVTKASDLVRQVDGTARDLLSKFYGVTAGDLTAYFLDKKRAMPALERQYQAVNVAAFAARAGLQVDNKRRYEDLIDRGLTPEMAAQGYGTVSAFNEAFGKIAGTYGESYSQRDAEEDVFFGMDEKRRKLLAKEAATFSGSSRGSTGRSDRGTSY